MMRDAREQSGTGPETDHEQSPRSFARRNWTKAEVYVLPGEPPLIVKDYGRCILPARLAGRFFLWMEERALKRLRGVPGVPRLIRRIGGNALCMEYVEGTPLSEIDGPGVLPPDFAERLDRLFDAVEARGVSHGDPHFSNILYGADGQPWLIDFAFSYVHGTVPVLDPWIRRNLAAVRRRRIEKLKRRFLGRPAEPVEVGGFYRLLIGLKRLYRRIKRLWSK